MPPLRRPEPTRHPPQRLIVGLDVGSASVKAVVVDPATDALLWSRYRRHEGRQRETCIAFISLIERTFQSLPHDTLRVFTTGSGAAIFAQAGTRFVQEVNALCLAVDKHYPDVRSAIELGGEDAKLIVFKTESKSGVRRRAASMNDKCAGGTGVVIDRIAAKLDIPPEGLGAMRYDGLDIHPVAGKCGVFAETDITGLLKHGVPPEQLMASLFDSIVRQNLSVLARGHTLHPPVLLLGGPNAFIRGMRECWRRHLTRMWIQRGVAIADGASPQDLIVVPDNALVFAALGAVEFGKGALRDDPDAGRYHSAARLSRAIETMPMAKRAGPSRPTSGPAHDLAALRAFRRAYERGTWRPRPYPAGALVRAYLGVDAGSTSTKGVLLDKAGEVIAKAYRLSDGDPIRDAQHVLARLEEQIAGQGCRLDVLGAATTGYAKDLLKDVIGADVALVETVAHMHSALQTCPNADVICDVGGQDIKVIFLRNGAVKDFRLNTQCSAGNGQYLQATATALGYAIERYAEVAFTAKRAPDFAHGCAVFLQSDVVDHQRRGWRPNEILAGLAAVLPKNVWLYVCQMPDLARLGRTFVLQGGVHRNAAAVKAQHDFIQGRFRHTGVAPEVIVHPHPGEAGAIGCALEALRRDVAHGRRTLFVGFEAFRSIRYRARRDESTRCRYCENRCLRTVIEIENSRDGPARPLPPRRVIVANCERGAAESVQEARRIGQQLERIKARSPNLAQVSAREAFRPIPVACVADPPPHAPRLARPGRRRTALRRRALVQARTAVRIGIPRVLDLYAVAPFFSAYFRSLGVPEANIVWSDYTTPALFAQGATRGSIDPCYPCKLAIPHIHNLLHGQRPPNRCLDPPDDAPLTHLFFPAIDTLPTHLHGLQASRSCPAAAATPEATHAAFVMESDMSRNGQDRFAERAIRFKKTFVNLDNPRLCARQMYEDWQDEIGLTQAESYRAVEQGLGALACFQQARRAEAGRVLETLEREGRVAIVLLARPYHNDPGINHGIIEAFQRRGYPILTQDSLPVDDAFIESLFGAELASGESASALSIDDVWKNAFSEHSSRKLWAAKVVARHPRLIGLELSNFKCGHDAPLRATIEGIIEAAGKPFFALRDLDENRSASAMNVRIETITYFLERYAGGPPLPSTPYLNAEPGAAPQAPAAMRGAGAETPAESGEADLEPTAVA